MAKTFEQLVPAPAGRFDGISRPYSPAEVEKYRAGKKNLLGFFVGQAMKELKGKGNPGALNGLFKKKLGD